MSQEDKNIKRMNDLIKKMDEKGAIIKEGKEVVVDKEELKKESDKFKALVNGGQKIDENYLSPTSHAIGGAGQTVNTFIGTDNGGSRNQFGIDRDSAMPAVSAGVTSKEAFEIAIRRTLESGGPVNGISFYDEVNWNLEKMGFPGKLPLDIKNAIKDIIDYGHIKD